MKRVLPTARSVLAIACVLGWTSVCAAQSAPPAAHDAQGAAATGSDKSDDSDDSGDSDKDGAGDKDDDAPEHKVPIGFSRLVVRLEGSDEIGVATGDFRVRLIERMRARGFDAVGAEDLVFGKDESRRADYLVGGTVKAVGCLTQGSLLSCRVGVEWELLDVASDQIVYKVMVRASVLHLSADRKERMAAMLLEHAMDRLLDRPRFRHALVAHADERDAPAPAFESASLPRCPDGKKVAVDADDLLDRAVVIKTHDGFGSGFFVSPEGLVLTAAHVVESNRMTLRLHDGTEVQAVPVRVAPREDVALVRTEKPLSNRRCLPLRTETAPTGGEVYAVGAPASLELAFSLTRGIVSGYPVLDGHRRLQTDAPVNPGNSGGPIVDATGRALGIVSFKVVAAKMEGLAFAVPMAEALAALDLHVGDETDPRLLTEKAVLRDQASAAAFVDQADPVPSLDPEGDRRRVADEAAERERERRREEQQAEEEQRAAEAADLARRTPWFIPAMRWGGVTVAAVGLVGAAVTFANYDSNLTTQPTFDSLRTWNTVAWCTAGVGGAAFVLSYVLRPIVLKKVSLSVGPTGIRWAGAF